MKNILVFGVFDGMHAGHDFFLREAATHGDQLLVSVARDAHVQELKRKSPMHNEQERLLAVQAHPCVSDARLSDTTLGSYTILETLKPDAIAFGHDQTALESSVRAYLEATHQEIPFIHIGYAKTTP